MLEKTFSPADVEKRQYIRSLIADAFSCGRSNGEAYTIMMPPPNVTGTLHIGHALSYTLQDVLARYHRMRGRDVLWQPGTDHAGIATQMVVEKQLAAQKISRTSLGREKFLEKVWEWKAQSGDAILQQFQRLGCSADWPRARFTMDDGLSHAVRKVFVQLYKDGLLYRDTRLVNWDTKLQTAISDLEVVQQETEGAYYYIRYPYANGEGYIVVATTRPETLLGDTAVAVHPDDPRYQPYIGQSVIVPLVQRVIPIVGDNYSNPEKGTGAVKITPAHDFNDFAVGKRHNLPAINILNADGTLNDATGVYAGLSVKAAREAVIAALQEQGLLEKIEATTHTVPYGDRSGTVIEPWLTEQWFIDAATLAKKAHAKVADGTSRFIPEQWVNTYNRWMEDIQPWCVSRQLWWGHQIPAWYAEDGRIFVAESAEAAQQQATAHYGHACVLRRDDDVLDTWFSSALWPFSTLGWPEKTPELQRYYPTSVLVTGFDIIFFWVARMMMLGLYIMDDVPFHDIYIHALVRDEHGQKMSKSKGNVVDPLKLIDDYGADAVRFTLTLQAAQGRDVKLSVNRIEGYRNFATKLWNASRFAEMNQCAWQPGFTPEQCRHPVNQWLCHYLTTATHATGHAIENYKFNEAAEGLYHFVWHTFCDWYVEFAKVLFADKEFAEETRACMAFALATIYKILHPIMPFITDELAQQQNSNPVPLTIQAWPQLSLPDTKPATTEIDWLIEAITTIRAARAAFNLPPVAIYKAAIDTPAKLGIHQKLLERLARVVISDTINSDCSFRLAIHGALLTIDVGDPAIYADAMTFIDKRLKKLQADMQTLQDRLNNQGFVSRAPEAIITETRTQYITLKAEFDRLYCYQLPAEKAAAHPST